MNNLHQFTRPGSEWMFPSCASLNVFSVCNTSSCVWIPVWKDGSQNHTITASKESNMQKMLEKQRMCRSWRIFLKTIGQFNCSGQRDSWTTITKNKKKQKTKQLWIIQAMTHSIKNQAYVICLVICVCILSCGLGYSLGYLNICNVKKLFQGSIKKTPFLWSILLKNK